jgi:hypothetical protein
MAIVMRTLIEAPLRGRGRGHGHEGRGARAVRGLDLAHVSLARVYSQLAAAAAAARAREIGGETTVTTSTVLTTTATIRQRTDTLLRDRLAATKVGGRIVVVVAVAAAAAVPVAATHRGIAMTRGRSRASPLHHDAGTGQAAGHEESRGGTWPMRMRESGIARSVAGDGRSGGNDVKLDTSRRILWTR